MEDKASNAKKGSDVVDELIQLLKLGDPALLLACYSIIKAQDPEMPKNWGPAVEHISKVTGRLKSDVQVSFTGTEVTLAIAVISAGTGGGNQVERKPIGDYRTDQGLPDELIRILKLFTGTTKPGEVAQTEFGKDADLSKGYAHFRDLSTANQKKLISYLRIHRKTMLERGLLGRGDAVIVDGKKMGVDHVNLFAFYDKQKPANKAWSYVAAGDVLQSVLTTDVQPSSRGERQIQLGHGITLKRYGGGLYAGHMEIKDHLQIQIQPRKILAVSTDWHRFRALTERLSFEIDDKLSNVQSEAAHRGLDAEQALIERINQHDPDCMWIVEECCDVEGYGQFKARKPGNREKPDVLLYRDTDDILAMKGISMKTYKPEVSFSQANRGSLETYVEELGMSYGVAETLRFFVVKNHQGERTMLNEAPISAQDELLLFFQLYQRLIISHVLRGKAKGVLKADWLLLHETKDEDWISKVGNRDCWHLYPMATVIDCCCSEAPSITKAGNLILGLGLTLQRKGGDGGAKSANDLQFKLNPKMIHEQLSKAKTGS
jgi:hypothetical protein